MGEREGGSDDIEEEREAEKCAKNRVMTNTGEDYF
jgi:hypothetical protein